ncbi:CRISPR-associated endonuclease Cas2 [Tamilnaduibacter salinus]|uniref:CRISPR-associated endoribonuclease Cas2 n=1 Tax=Tamilnaduibacter salinus TaxID=1484056 RepID=A0A2A2I7B4_9GAMM|nr:CRISPR-associated endonuclease Cas2 [Tamilnaduibacter salinus]PAV27547.1 CRISPR-associated endonuclease Cas2 [Tamilnaduibacter salinus]
MLERQYLVCYDISDNKKRTRFFEHLKDLGLEPVQKSVMWGFLRPADVKALQVYGRKELEKPDDRLIITPVRFDNLSPDSLQGYLAPFHSEPRSHAVL